MAYRPDLFKHRRKNPVDALRESAELDHGIYVGEVIVRPKDDSHSGRITVYIPMLAKDREDPTGYFNCYWSSPFAGSTPSAKIGKNVKSYDETMKTYGMWMVPPDPGNFVLVIFGDGKKKFPIIIGCLFPDQMQNMVPGIPSGTTYGSSLPLPVAEKNKREEDPSHGKDAQRPLHHILTKAILDQGLINDPIRGITTAGARRESPSQVFGILTPGPEEPSLKTGKKDGTNRRGGHQFVMDDNLDQRHIRLRTALGNQILMDDTNGIIYVINSKGTAWVELAENGSVHVFSDENINMRATKNINVRADEYLNLEGGLGVNINAGVYTEKTGDIQINAGNDIKTKAGHDHLLDVENLISARALGEYRLTSGGDGHLRVANKHVISGSEIMENASGEINSQAGGNNNVIGSNVNLNNGGGADQATEAEGFENIPEIDYEDVSVELPEFVYDETNPREDNPLPTDGERAGEGIEFKSTIPVVPTREPWVGHATQTAIAQDPKKMESKDSAVKDNPPNAISQNDKAPATVVNNDGSIDVGTGYSDTPPTPNSTPQYNKSKFTASVSDAAATLNNMDANGLADACAGVVAGGSSNLMTPMTNASGDKVVGFGHVLDRNELDAGAMVFGDGKILDPQSGFKNPGMKKPANEYADIIKNVAKEELVNYGLEKITGTESYKISGTKNTIVHNLQYPLMNKISKDLSSNGLSTSGKFIANAVGGASMSRNSSAAVVMFANSIGGNNFMNSDVSYAIQSGDSSRLIPQLFQKWTSNSIFRPTLKQRRIYEAILFGMPDMYRLEMEQQIDGMGWGIMAQRIKRKQYEYFASDGMPAPRGIANRPLFGGGSFNPFARGDNPFDPNNY